MAHYQAITPGHEVHAVDPPPDTGGRTYRVVVETGADFSSNVGDESYFAAMVDLFRARFGERIRITKLANDPKTIADRYGIDALYSGQSPRRRLAALWPTLRAIAKADLYVWGGGQMPLDSHGMLSVLYRFHRPMLAKLLGTPVMSYAIGAGPLDMRRSLAVTRHCMNLFDVITVRDRYSAELLEHAGVNKPIHQTVDSAIVLEAAPAQRIEHILRLAKAPLGQPLIGVVPWGPAFRKLRSMVPVIFRRKHYSREDRARLAEHCSLLAEALDSFIEPHGAFVLLVAMDSSQGHGFDDRVAALTQQKMKHASQTHLLLGSRYHPKEVKGLLGRCEMVIGSRMHGLILATGEAVPTVGVCFTDKVRDFARLTGQEDTYVNASELATSADLLPLMERCWNEREERGRNIRHALEHFSEKARRNVDLLEKLLESTAGFATPAPVSKAAATNAKRGNIGEVVSDGLCHFCGTCYGVCPQENVRIEREWDDQPRFTVIDESLCESCGLCRRLCPGLKVDFAAGRELVFGRQPGNELLGCFDKLLATRSKRQGLLATATSGATVSEIARHILEEGLADGVAVTSMDYSHGRPRPKTWIAQDVSDLSRLRGSIYMSAPVNTVLRAIWNSKSAKRIALIGLGCHIEGLRAAQRQLSWARERVPLAIGLFCGHGVRPAATWHLLRRMELHPEDLAELAYRAGETPGRLTATTSAGCTREMKMCDYSYALTCYGNARCSMCVDPLCELADISVGDAWLPELRRDGPWNLTVVRTQAGGEIVEALIEAGKLEAAPTTEDKLTQAQRLQLYNRERGAWARMALRRRFGKGVPLYTGVAARDVRPADLRRALMITAAQQFAQSPWAQSLMGPMAWVRAKLLDLLPGRSKKDNLIGRDESYSKEFFRGREY